PTALMHNLKHNKILHEHNAILTIITTDTPRVAEADRVTITQVSPRFSRIALRFGYMEIPNVPKALALARKKGWTFDIMSTSFFLSRRALRQEKRRRHNIESPTLLPSKSKCFRYVRYFHITKSQSNPTEPRRDLSDCNSIRLGHAWRVGRNDCENRIVFVQNLVVFEIVHQRCW